MTTEWYCKIMGEEIGPLSLDELTAIARWGRLSRDDTVRSGASGTWVRAELVSGLFDRGTSPTKNGSDSAVAKRLAGSPARRTVRRGNQEQYWFRIGPKIVGPFSAQQLKQLAENGLLRRFYLVSNDQRHWTRASLVRGLVFSSLDEDFATLSIRSAVVVDQPLDWSNVPMVDAAPIAADA